MKSLHAHTIPVNTTAKLVVGKGTRFDPKLSEQAAANLFDDLPDTVPIPVNPQFVDFTGEKKGRLRIVGYAGAGRWIARCVCGKYTKRSTQAWRKAGDDASHFMCPECDRREFLRGTSLNTARSLAKTDRAVLSYYDRGEKWKDACRQHVSPDKFDQLEAEIDGRDV